MVVGMAVQAAVGFGFGFFVAPAALGVFHPAQAVTLLLLLALLINALILCSEGREREIEPRAVVLIGGAALPGIVVGALVVRHLQANVLQVVVGVGIVIAAALQARAQGVQSGRRPDATLATGGLAAGVFTTATSLNGPAVVLTLTRAGYRGHPFRDTAAAAFLVLGVTGTAALVALAHAGHSLPHWPLLVALVPAVAVGHRIGAMLFRRLDDQRHRRLVLAAAVVAGTVSVIAGLA